MEDMRESDRTEAAHAKIESALNILIELVSDTDSKNEDAAYVLMRTRDLVRTIRPDFLTKGQHGLNGE